MDSSSSFCQEINDSPCYDTSNFGKTKTRKKRRSKFDLCNVYKHSESRPYFSNKPGESKFYEDPLADMLATDPSLNLKPQQFRTVFTHEQTIILEAAYQRTTKPDVKQKEMVALLCGLSFERVRIWYQNRKAKEKRVQEDELAVLAEKINSSKASPFDHLNRIDRSIRNIFKENEENSEETFIKQLLKQKDFKNSHKSSLPRKANLSEEDVFKTALQTQRNANDNFETYQKETEEEEEAVNNLLQTYKQEESETYCGNSAYSTIRQKGRRYRSNSSNSSSKSNEEGLVRRLIKEKTSRPKTPEGLDNKPPSTSRSSSNRKKRGHYKSSKHTDLKRDERRRRRTSRDHYSEHHYRQQQQQQQQLPVIGNFFSNPLTQSNLSSMHPTDPSFQQLLSDQNQQATCLLHMYQQLAALGIPLTAEQLTVMNYVNQQTVFNSYQQLINNDPTANQIASMKVAGNQTMKLCETKKETQPDVPTYGGTIGQHTFGQHHHNSWYNANTYPQPQERNLAKQSRRSQIEVGLSQAEVKSE